MASKRIIFSDRTYKCQYWWFGWKTYRNHKNKVIEFLDFDRAADYLVTSRSPYLDKLDLAVCLAAAGVLSYFIISYLSLGMHK